MGFKVISNKSLINSQLEHLTTAPQPPRLLSPPSTGLERTRRIGKFTFFFDEEEKSLLIAGSSLENARGDGASGCRQVRGTADEQGEVISKGLFEEEIKKTTTNQMMPLDITG